MAAISLEQAVTRHPINAKIFLPFVVAALSEGKWKRQASLTVALSGSRIKGRKARTLRVQWEKESVPDLPLGVDDKTVTEWAACGVACVLLAEYAGMNIRAVAREGDRFDYWVTDGQQGYGLEVSGTMATDIGEFEARYREKVRQLCDNPYGVDGYVVVVGFALRRAALGFHSCTANEEPDNE